MLIGWGGEVDMWAVGILLFWMLSGHTPFQADSISAIFVNIELGRSVLLLKGERKTGRKKMSPAVCHGF